MAPMSNAGRIVDSRNRHRTHSHRKPARRHHRPIGILEQCESRTLLTTLYGVTAAAELVKFGSVVPGDILQSKPITNIGEGETIQGIDFRPANGQLYALTTDASQTGRIYTIEPDSAVATIVSTVDVPVTGTSFGVDFNPMADRLRVVSDADLSLRIDVATGAATADGTLVYGGGDPSAGQDPNAVGSAYSNNFAGTSATTLYQVDSTLDILAIQSPPNAGTLATVGALGVDASAVVGFDIQTAGGQSRGYATLVVGGSTGLYEINLSTGAATLIAPVGAPVSALAIAPAGFTSKVDGSTVILTGSGSPDELVIDQAGRLLRHNQFDLGVAGYASPFDFDSSLPGEQTVSSVDSAVLVVVNARGGNDTVALGSATAPLSFLAASFKINLQDGPNNRLTLNDSASPNGQTITTTAFATSSGVSTTILGFGPTVIFNSDYDSQPDIYINAGQSNDIFNVAESFGLSGFRLLFNGGGGSDTLNADARGAAVNATTIGIRFHPIQTYSVSVGYASIEQVNITNVHGRDLVEAVDPSVVTVSVGFAGTEFTDRLVARFKDLDPGAKAADYQVTIAWGDGTSSAGTIVQSATDPTLFYVYGSHRYSAPGKFTVTSTILDTGGSSTFSGPGIAAHPVSSHWLVSEGGGSIIVTSYSSDDPTTFDFNGMYAFDSNVVFPPPNVTVTTTYLAERPIVTTSEILVLEAAIAVAGRLDAASDTGLSNQDGITNDNTPTFTGTSAPGALIEIFSDIAPATRRLIASAVADANGVWQATVLEPLADGLYANLVLDAVSATGGARAIGSLASLTVDTVAPTVTNLEFRRINGQINATFQDDRSGLDQTGITNLANYGFAGNGPAARRNRRLAIRRATTTPQGDHPTQAQVVNLTINNSRRLRAGRYTFTANASGIVDLAGNALNGEFTGRFPSGNAQPGGNFVAGLRPLRRIVPVSNTPGETVATRQSGNRHPAGPNQGAPFANRLHAASFKAQGRKIGG